ncbi:hypothetical protein [Pseudomonas typographi]|uniref:Uncharacterized protein n=1 Tax=Pseudomonas typographi TaxID=2715964 RepID=A0ABR7Z2D1_9PSED|nr:hypothetical protein [Pseudomonas typographi]MBD1552377.1 hypothetical protein [Pseudomonas typographi]MBD1599543.1 hypothetical protein [Pseudomonas typographi]
MIDPKNPSTEPPQRDKRVQLSDRLKVQEKYSQALLNAREPKLLGWRVDAFFCTSETLSPSVPSPLPAKVLAVEKILKNPTILHSL